MSSNRVHSNLVSIKKLQENAVKFPPLLRDLLTQELDSMNVEEFIVKLGIWERILRFHREGENLDP